MTTTLLAPPVFDDVTRREFVIGGLSLAALLAACGDDGGEPQGATSETRTVTGSRGPVDVPVDPKRVAALVGSVDVDVLAFGIEPVYAGSFAEGWVDLPDGTVTGDIIPPNLETLAATEPDLLLGWDWLADDAAWDELRALAPVVAIPETGTWRDAFRVVADAVNRRQEADNLLVAFDARLDGMAAQLATRPPIEVAQIGFYAPGTFSWYGQDRDTTALMRQIGLSPIGPEETVQEASVERLGELTAPWITVHAAGGDGEGALEAARDNPLWATLPAVQSGQVVEVDYGIWTGAGFLWAQALVDDLERRFIVR